MSEPLPIAISVGCPSSIGPEVSVRALAAFEPRCVLVGDRAQLEALAEAHGVSLAHHDIVTPGGALPPEDRLPGRPTARGGAAQLAYVDEALSLVTSGRARAMCTGPVSKEMIARSGVAGAERFRGHTEHLAERLGAPEVVMAFWCERLTTALVTTHLPLARVPAAIDEEGVCRATYWLARLLADLDATRTPRVVVASLNPHAGEQGLLGHEEIEVIGPGIERARARLLASSCEAVITGPMGAESAFRLAVQQRAFDGVVAMYHDQATIPMKLLGFGDAVNISLGLPIVRTSVDHGTAYDQAGRGTADAKGMMSALALADRLTRPRG